MSVVLGLFVGGSGKYVAQLLKGWSEFYGWTFDGFLVLDVDPEEVLKGRFALGDDLVLPEDAFRDALQATIAEWSKDNFGQRIVRWETRYEASVMHSAAKALSRIPQAASGGMWTLRAMGLPGFDAFLRSGRGRQFLDQLRDMLARARQDHPDEHIVVYVISSTAGGTGAGLSIPLAMKVRELCVGAHPSVVPIAVMSSAFHNDWGSESDPGSVNTRTRGETGTFAVWRELAFLSAKLDFQAMPARRIIPVATSLRYFDAPVTRAPDDPRPGFTLAEHVLWFGRRSVDAAAKAADCFEELARAFAALSTPRIAKQLQGHNAFQRSHLRLIPSCVSVEYRRLETAERLAGKLLVETITRTFLADANLLAQAPSFFAWTPGGTAPIIAFIRDQRDNLFAQDGFATAGTVPTSQFLDFLRALVPNNTLLGKPPISEEDRGAYDATDTDWHQIMNKMILGFETQFTDLARTAKEAINQDVNAEFHAAQQWLRKAVVEDNINNHVEGLQTARRSLESVRGEFRRIAQLFRRPWTDVIVDDARVRRLPGPEEALGALETAKSALYPTNAQVQAQKGGRRNSVWGPLLSVAVGIAAGLGAFFLDLEIAGAVSVGAAAAFFVWLFTSVGPSPTGKTRAQLRREAVERVQQAFETRLLATRAQYAWTAIQETLMSPLVGFTHDPGQSTEFGFLLDSLDDLQTLLADVRDSLRGRLQALEHSPPSVVVEVGKSLEIPAAQARALERDLRSSIRFVVSDDQQPQLAATLNHRGGVRFAVRDLLNRENVAAAADGYQSLLQHLTAIAQAATTQAQALPESFTDIVSDPQVMAEYLAELGKKANVRGPACEVENGLAAPAITLLICGNEKLQALVGNAVNNHLRNSNRPEHRRIVAAIEASGGGVAQISERVGESVLLFDIWEFGADQRLEDIRRAQTYYYSYSSPLDDTPVPERFCAGNFEFHIVPELSVAAYVELKRSLGTPTHPALVQRLRGCDPRLPGPTVLDLFYLARRENLLQLASDELQLKVASAPSHDIMIPLLQTQLHDPGAQAPFGTGRALMSQFDAFSDFMAYEAGIADPAAVTSLSGVGAQILAYRWVALGQLIGEVKQQLAKRFYSLRGQVAQIETVYDECLKLAEQDAALFPEPVASQWLAVCRTVFEHAVSKLRT